MLRSKEKSMLINFFKFEILSIAFKLILQLCECYEHTQKEDLRDFKDEKVSIKLRCYLITIVLFANR